MKHTVCQVAIFEHAKCKYVLCILWFPYPNAFRKLYNVTCATWCTSPYNFNSRRSDDIVIFVLENTIPWMWKSNCTHCANWHFSSHCSDEAQFTPSGHLLSPDSRQGRHVLGLLEYSKLIYCQCVWQYWAKLPNIHLLADKMQRLLTRYRKMLNIAQYGSIQLYHALIS